MKGARQKGNGAEREVARFMVEWWGRLEPGVQFIRTPLSGGWASPGAREAFRASGDLMTTSRRFPFCVEVKRREGWSYDRLRDGRPCPVWGWWRQTMVAAQEVQLDPLLWFRRNRGPWYVMLPREHRVLHHLDPLLEWTAPELAAIDVVRLPAVIFGEALLGVAPGATCPTPRRLTTLRHEELRTHGREEEVGHPEAITPRRRGARAAGAA